jgi:hypothetical protein
MDMGFVIKDDQGRPLVKINDHGGCLIARYPDMNESYKEYILGLYGEVTDGNVEKMRRFLNFEDSQRQFCS